MPLRQNEGMTGFPGSEELREISSGSMVWVCSVDFHSSGGVVSGSCAVYGRVCYLDSSLCLIVTENQEQRQKEFFEFGFT